MNIELNSDLAKEIVIISTYLDDINIPDNIFNQLVDLASKSTKEIHIDKNKKLKEQEISEECKDWLSVFYYESTDSDTKKVLLEKWAKNLIEQDN